LLSGARQVGKSTLLRQVLGPDVRSIVFDPVVDVGAARRDPEFFLAQHPPPVLLDEVQYAPELLPVLKRWVDRDPKPGQYFLTGSQNLALLKDVSESLAGRAMVLELPGLSLAERCGSAVPGARSWIEDLFEADALARLRARGRLAARAAEPTLFARLWRGGMPGLLDLRDELLPDVFASYVRTYVERDVRRVSQVEDQQLFSRFLALCAALSGQEVNHSQLGRELGVTPQTAARWLALLGATFQWLEVQPYHGNTIKRISSRPKGYLTDTGLAAYLQHVSSPQALGGHPLQGALFETHTVLEVLKLVQVCAARPQLLHWRAHGGAEVDLLLERDALYVPLEVKSTARVRAGDARGIRAFRETYPHLRHGLGVIVAAVEEVSELRDGVVVVPYDLA
jgi:predicted AAA+ superfamily ATPase